MNDIDVENKMNYTTTDAAQKIFAEVIKMIEKIEKINRVKGIDFDVGKKYDSRGGRDDNGSFANTLKRVLNKKADPARSEIPEAYRLELSSNGTQSLFYFGGLNLQQLLT